MTIAPQLRWPGLRVSSELVEQMIAEHVRDVGGPNLLMPIEITLIAMLRALQSILDDPNAVAKHVQSHKRMRKAWVALNTLGEQIDPRRRPGMVAECRELAPETFARAFGHLGVSGSALPSLADARAFDATHKQLRIEQRAAISATKWQRA